MRADRLLSILLLLQNHRRMTAAILAEKLEVSERTIYRDIEALSIAGIPVYMERGTGGGIFLPQEYRSGVTSNLTEQEVQALLVSPIKLLSDLGLKRASESAMLKLLAALPLAFRSQMENVTERIYIDNSRWRENDEVVPCLKAVQEAVFNDRHIRFTYNKKDSLSERTVGALGLVSKGSIWYLVGLIDGEVRTYRVSRMEKSEVVQEERVIRPANFNLQEFWLQSMAVFPNQLPRYPVVLMSHADSLPLLHNAGHWSRVVKVGQADEVGWCRVELLFEQDDDALKCVLEHSPYVKVVEPEELRERVISALKGAIALYNDSACTN